MTNAIPLLAIFGLSSILRPFKSLFSGLKLRYGSLLKTRGTSKSDSGNLPFQNHFNTGSHYEFLFLIMCAIPLYNRPEKTLVKIRNKKRAYKAFRVIDTNKKDAEFSTSRLFCLCHYLLLFLIKFSIRAKASEILSMAVAYEQRT